MASVWQEMKGKAATKLAGGMKPKDACAELAKRAKAWVDQGGSSGLATIVGLEAAKRIAGEQKKQERVAVRVYGHTYGLVEGGKLVGSMYVEMMSPPSKPEPGQIYVDKGAAA